MVNEKKLIRIVLVGTTHPGNIGAAARAMKTMCQDRLYLVSPKIYPSAEATARATGADDVLANATVCDDLKQAVAECNLVIGTTARDRSLSWPVVNPAECAELAVANEPGETAIIFGRESSGLSNEELELCNYVMKISTNPEYGSLNLASAVQLTCYEIFNSQQGKENNSTTGADIAYASQDQLQQLYQSLEQTMRNAGYLNPNNPKKLMHRMHRLFNRSRMEESEVNILRGFLNKIDEKINS